MARRPLRVAILGNAGSGKSTLARRLAERYGVPVLDLDTVAWEPGGGARRREAPAAASDVTAFCEAHAGWIVEGCYPGLIRAALAHRPWLLLLDPGPARCEANCRARPWEPHKYASKAEQDAGLPFLLAWVADYYTRRDEFSLTGHLALFDGYDGPKRRLVNAAGRGDSPAAGR